MARMASKLSLERGLYQNGFAWVSRGRDEVAGSRLTVRSSFWLLKRSLAATWGAGFSGTNGKSTPPGAGAGRWSARGPPNRSSK